MAREKTSLEKSHSAWSNLKLTLLSLVTVLSTSAFWATLALIDILSTPLFIGILATSALVTLMCIALFSRFKR